MPAADRIICTSYYALELSVSDMNFLKMVAM